MLQLEGRRCLITGAGGGIGSAAAEQFAAAGARLVLTDRAEVLSQAPAPPGSLQFPAELTDPAEVGELFAAASAHLGGLDVLFNVAGGSGRSMGDGPVDACSLDGWRQTLRINLDTVFFCCREAIPRLKLAGGGSIINLSSVLATNAHELFATHGYAAAKGAILSLSRAMARSYAADGIRVNCICPGLIRTGMSRRAQADPAILAALAELQPLGAGFGSPDDIASAALFLASDQSRFITGAALPVDGGWSTL